MRIALDNYIHAFTALPEGVREAELDTERREEQYVSVERGAAAASGRFDATRLYLRATGKSTGYIYTENMEDDPRELMLAAVENAKDCPDAVPERMNDGAEPVRIYAEDDGFGYNDLLEAARALERTALSNPEIHEVAECRLRKTSFTRRVVNSRGMDNYSENIYYFGSLGVKVRRSDGRHTLGERNFCVRSLNELDCGKLADAALAEANVKDGGGSLGRVDLPSGKYAAVISSAVVRNILMTAWRVFAGSSMLSGASPFSCAPGTRIGSGLLHIRSGPNCPGWGYNIPLDSEGTLCAEKRVVEGGYLKMPLYDLTNAWKAGATPTGNAGRGVTLSGVAQISTQILPGVFYIEPGDMPVEKLIVAMGDGIHITYSMDEFHTVNISDGTFSIPCGGVVYSGGNKTIKREERTMKTVDIAVKSGGHYSAGVISGNTLYISGQLPRDPDTGAIPGGIAEQTRLSLKNVEAVLLAAGLTRNDVVMCRAFTADHTYWEAVNREYAAFFGDHKPARIIVPIKGFAPGILIEIEAVAEAIEKR